MMNNTLIRLPTVIARVGLQRTAIYDRISSGLFPAPVKLGTRTSVWPENEVDACNDAVIKGKSPDEIKTLVKQLQAQRQA